MRKDRRNNPKETFLFALLVLIAISISSPGSARGDSASEIDLKVTKSLKMLYDTTPGAKLLSKNAKGLLVFPKIVKFGFLAGTQIGDGALLKEGKPTDYYRSISASFGLQAGLRAFDYVLMFMDDKSTRLSRQERRLGTWFWARYCSIEKRICSISDLNNSAQRRLRFYFRPPRCHGWDRIAGDKDNEVQAKTIVLPNLLLINTDKPANLALNFHTSGCQLPFKGIRLYGSPLPSTNNLTSSPSMDTLCQIEP